VSLRILFADDSMTAQNMGKKILTDAGYEVVAVSNGAAAVKKIAEHKPDIIILDIYMPGYSGLEVCDKVRTSTDTVRTPVLLTVGKMEPYKLEDANRVRADGVIIKPFEASDLLAVIKKLEERVVPKRTQEGEETILLERPDFAEFAMPTPENHREVHAEPSENRVQSTVDVPDNMASIAAFSELLGTDLGHSPLPRESFSSEPEVWPEASAESVPPNASDDGAATSGRVEEKVENLDAIAVADTGSATATIETVSLVPDTEEIPAYREPEPAIEEVHAPPEPEKVIAQESSDFAMPEANPSAAETQSFIDPGLAIHVASFEPFTAKVVSEVEKIEAIVSASEARHKEAEATNAASENGFEQSLPATDTATSSEADFEARVAEAMSIYDQPLAEESDHVPTATVIETAPEPEPAEPPASFEYSPPVNASTAESPVEPVATAPAEPVSASETIQSVDAVLAPVVPVVDVSMPVEDAPIKTGPVLITSEATQVIPVFLDPPVTPEQPGFIQETPMSTAPTFVSTEATQEIPVYLESPTEPGPREATPVAQAPGAVPEEAAQAVEEKAAASIEAELPAMAAAAAGFSGVDTVMINAVVDRILDRLKPQLIEEISRELKTKK
jgi:CheY-like chemotaxis protein